MPDRRHPLDAWANQTAEILASLPPDDAALYEALAILFLNGWRNAYRFDPMSSDNELGGAFMDGVRARYDYRRGTRSAGKRQCTVMYLIDMPILDSNSESTSNQIHGNNMLPAMDSNHDNGHQRPMSCR